MPATYKILIMGASYCSLLASKLLFGGHKLHLVCLPAEADLINSEGFRVRLPVRGRKDPVELDSRKLQAKNLAPTDVVNAISAQNLILPTGTTKIGSTEYSVGLNASPGSIEGLNDIPIRTGPGCTIYIKDVAHVRDGFQPQTNIVRVDGTRASLLTINKSGNPERRSRERISSTWW